MKLDRQLLIIFAVLDVLLFLRLLPLSFDFSMPLHEDYPLFSLINLQVVPILLAPFVAISLLVSAYGLWRQQVWAFYLYYIQLPFRLLCAMFSFGFLLWILPSGHTIENGVVTLTLPYYINVIMLFTLEFARLGMTVWIHAMSRGGQVEMETLDHVEA